jgi:hypothetical protein
MPLNNFLCDPGRSAKALRAGVSTVSVQAERWKIPARAAVGGLAGNAENCFFKHRNRFGAEIS